MTNFKPLLLLGLMLMLSACGTIRTPTTSPPTPPPASIATPTATSGTSPALVCAELRIVQLSVKDTDGTKTQVEANNHVLTALCGLK